MPATYEENLVAVVRAQGVSIAYPANMSKLDLACVLQALATEVFRELAENGSGERPAIPDASRFAGLKISEPSNDTIQVNGRTKADRRGLPRKKVLKRTKGGRREELACGHVIDPVPTNWKKHKSRACAECAAALQTA